MNISTFLQVPDSMCQALMPQYDRASDIPEGLETGNTQRDLYPSLSFLRTIILQNNGVCLVLPLSLLLSKEEGGSRSQFITDKITLREEEFIEVMTGMAAEAWGIWPHHGDRQEAKDD